MIDCFGIDMSEAEYDAWQRLTSGQFYEGKSTGTGGFPADREPISREQFKPIRWFWSHTLPLTPDDLRDKCVMELGCGDGIHAGEVLHYGGTYTGIDISHFALICARKRYAI